MKPSIRSLVAGAVWGILAAILVGGLPWYASTGMLILGPLFGLAVYGVSRWSYRSKLATVLWTIPSVFFATLIFGLVAGLLDIIQRGSQMILLSMVSPLYVLATPSPFWLLFPLALITHLWVRAGINLAKMRSNHSPAPAPGTVY